MIRPEDALAEARAEVERLKALGRYGEPPEGLMIEPLDQVTRAQLLEWALIEPDLTKLRSTRRLGAPLTWAKRMLLRALRQYHNEVVYRQTRFNIHVLRKVLELEDRIERSSGEARSGGERSESEEREP